MADQLRRYHKITGSRRTLVLLHSIVDEFPVINIHHLICQKGKSVLEYLLQAWEIFKDRRSHWFIPWSYIAVHKMSFLTCPSITVTVCRAELQEPIMSISELLLGGWKVFPDGSIQEFLSSNIIRIYVVLNHSLHSIKQCAPYTALNYPL